MSVNTMDIQDIRSIVNSLHNQATGHTVLTATTTADFVSQATTALQAAPDTVYSQLMQVVMRPIFAVRDYNEKFSGLFLENNQFGAIKRKISFSDKDIQTAEQVFHPVDNTTVDQFLINKADPVEMRFYGSAVYQDWVTTFRDQLKVAFSNEEELSGFITALATHQNNKYKQYRENLARATLSNFIAAKYSATNGVYHLLTEYNTLTAMSPALTAQEVWQPGNIEPFFRWVRGRINNIARLMNERSEEFQVQLTGHSISRHTPYEDMRMYLNANALDIIDTMVNTTTFHDEPLAYSDVEAVTYWQSIKTPDEINVTPTYIDATGAVQTAGAAVNVQKVFGVIFDRDAVGINQEMYDIDVSPYNARGKYWNTFLSSRCTYMNDLTEKGAILLLD